MGKGNYIGGNTHISLKQNPDWFGAGEIEDEAYRQAQAKFEAAEKRYREILKERDAGAKGPAFRKRLNAARDAMDAARPRPRKAKAAEPISRANEERIATLKRDIAAHAKQVQAAAAAHESLRQELIALLKKNDMPLTAYPETRKLIL